MTSTVLILSKVSNTHTRAKRAADLNSGQQTLGVRERLPQNYVTRVTKDECGWQESKVRRNPICRPFKAIRPHMERGWRPHCYIRSNMENAFCVEWEHLTCPLHVCHSLKARGAGAETGGRELPDLKIFYDIIPSQLCFSPSDFISRFRKRLGSACFWKVREVFFVLCLTDTRPVLFIYLFFILDFLWQPHTHFQAIFHTLFVCKSWKWIRFENPEEFFIVL